MSPSPDPPIVALFGLSHRTAPVDLRERLAFSSSRMVEGLETLRRDGLVEEAVILSTCNRVEIYAPLGDGVSPQLLARFLCRFHGLSEEDLRGKTYAMRGREAVRHLFRVASGLDSQVVGEAQILSQVKGAYLRAKSGGHTGKALNLLFQKALKVGKDVRSKTRIGEQGVSVASVAIGFMKKIFEDLESKVVMVIGSGEMGEVTVEQLSRLGVKGILTVNRSPERAEELASRFGGAVVLYDDLPARLGEADIVITSTAAPHAIISAEDVRGAMKSRRRAPQVYMDIAIPRDVEPAAGKIGNVYLYNVDDLDRAISHNLEDCARETSLGEEIVDLQVEAYLALRARMDLGPLITRMRDDLRAMIRAELAPLVRGGAGGPGPEALDRLVDRLTGKILHGPIRALQGGSDEENREELREVIGRLFCMNGAEPEPPGDRSHSPERQERA